ncbi:LPXTG cell wall anchor domain-containing protein [Lactiplantibacillus sp. E932]|jgi:LPXTG-motif cell wall-anchored protein|uniref:mucin-binding protein n=1 Tax=Lactiplantibacillus plantarum TaxID=1590 RepID=UPI000FCC9088|nr:LPXTG cell wall anchor domain-containing protein [Lactiplantibacillus plantarum]MCM8649160.1 LPXTG cell wall anchor domain-containing protein [Lactiplantibacillus sp. E932]MCG0630134.1 LPXTG cell wall anchor domain-containing protein [Lactiplantibacillus plantarum]MCW6134158.1 LPXTG cell wall anchor domain-containing protein [Lactiplantibacillus plantarum]MDO7546504.1 LPXTG cell wall anchor domain-containing protein [Lactiplantibacillus plantarum]QJS46734.1 LPXTG cell wall anchor domain-con
MRYTRGKWRVTNPKVWLFSSVLILGWRIVPTVAQASEAETVTMSSHSVQLETDNQDQLTEVARISKTAVTRNRHSVTAQSSKSADRTSSEQSATTGTVEAVSPTTSEAQQRSTQQDKTAVDQQASDSTAASAVASTNQASAATSSDQVPVANSTGTHHAIDMASSASALGADSGAHSESLSEAQRSGGQGKTIDSDLSGTVHSQSSVSTVTTATPVNSNSSLESDKFASTRSRAVAATDQMSSRVEKRALNKTNVTKSINIPVATKQPSKQRTVTASSFLTTAKNLADKNYLDQYAKQHGQAALIALIQDWLSTYRIIALTGITIVNSSFDGSVATISGGLHVINTGATIRSGQDDEWETIINGGLSVTNNTITFTTTNGLVDRPVANQDMDFTKPRPTGNGAIKGLPSVTVDSSLINAQEFSQAQINISDFYDQLVTAGTILSATNGGTLSKMLIGESGTADLGSYQGHHYYAVNIDLNDWYSGIRTTGFNNDDVVIYNVVTAAPALTIGGGFSSSTPNLVWNFNHAMRIQNTTMITGKIVAPHAVFTTNQNVDSAAVLQYGYGDGDSAIRETITSQNEHNYGFGQVVTDDPLDYLIAVIKSDGTSIDTLAGFRHLLATGQLKITITDAAGTRLSGLNAVDTHIAGQHRYLITYQFGDQTATTWLNVQPSHEPIIPISRIPEYSAITRTINYQDERTGAVLAGPVIQNVRVVRFAIFNAKTHELLGYDTNGDGIVDTSDGTIAWLLVPPTDQDWVQVVSPDLSAQGYQAPDIPVVAGQTVIINGGDRTMNTNVIVKYQQQTHIATTQRTVTRTINYIDGGTLQPIASLHAVVQTVKYQLLAVVAHDGTILGYDTNGDGQIETQLADEAWLIVGSGPWFGAVKSPDLSHEGYAAPDLKVVPEQMVAVVDDKDVTINVYYRLATQAVTVYQNKRRVISYIDRQTHQSIATTVQQLVIYQRTAIIEKKTGKCLGYDLNGDGLVDTSQADYAWILVGSGQFAAVTSPTLVVQGYTDPDIRTVAAQTVAITDPDLMTTIVTYDHRIITVTPGNPARPGQPVDPDNPNILFPDEGGDTDLTHTVTRIIHYVYEDGTTAAASVLQTVQFQRNAMIDLVTGEVTYQEWVPVSVTEMAGVISPIVAGATTTLTEVAAQQVSVTTADQVVVVTYKKSAIKPEEPGQPEQPSQPEEPGHPEQPSQPEEPGHPEQPSQPEESGHPEQPSQPEEPGQHEQPSQPEEPGQSEKPGELQKPSQPADSEQPDGLSDQANLSRNQAEQSRTSQPSQAESDQSVVQTNQQKTAASVSGIGWVSAPAVSKRTTKHHRMTTLPQTDEQNTQLSLLGVIGLALSSILGWLKIKSRD